MLQTRGIAHILTAGALVLGGTVVAAPAALAKESGTASDSATETTTPTYSELAEGDKQWEVVVLGFLMFDYGYYHEAHVYEHFDSTLDESVRDYQTDNGLASDGVVDQDTWEQIRTDFDPVSHGDEGNRVKAAQQALIHSDFSEEIVLDGVFDDTMLNAVTEFQDAHGIDENGVVGQDTLHSLLTS